MGLIVWVHSEGNATEPTPTAHRCTAEKPGSFFGHRRGKAPELVESIGIPKLAHLDEAETHAEGEEEVEIHDVKHVELVKSLARIKVGLG